MRPIDTLLVVFITLALVAVVVSKNAQTSNTIQGVFAAMTGAVTKIMQPLSH